LRLSRVPVSREGAKLRSQNIGLFRPRCTGNLSAAAKPAVRIGSVPGFFMGTDIYSILTIKLAMRQVILTPGEDGYWVAEVPSLPGCISQGKTREEALINIKEAIEGYIAALKDDGIPVPKEHFQVLVAVV
jgi:predicted RNase H-like HicB family nuclease